MKQKAIIIVFILFAVNSIAQKVDKLPYAIFKFDSNLFTPFPANSRNASLDSSEVLKIDSFIGLFATNYNERLYGNFTKNIDSTVHSYLRILLKKYKMQLVAIIDSNGDKLVWVNCFCGDIADNYWQKEIVAIDDGDNCFFDFKVNLSKNRYYDSHVHGG